MLCFHHLYLDANLEPINDNLIDLGDLRVKEKSEKAGLKVNIQKTKIMVSSPITSWQIDGKNVEIVSDFISSGSKINADSDCSHKIKDSCF